MQPNIMVVWIYVALLLVGGLMGFLKAGSKASLIASSAFAVALSLAMLFLPQAPYVVDILLGVLLFFFGLRYVKSKKMMPAGMMTILTLVTLVLRNMV
jgi:uncharacterized membrane protein (UPF0136 family)